MRQNKTCFTILCILLTVLGISCTKEFEEHYNPSEKIDKNIVEILSANPDFSEFVKIIDKVDLRKALGEGAIFTCLAPRNEHLILHFKQLGFENIDKVPVLELRKYVNSHFITGMITRLVSSS